MDRANQVENELIKQQINTEKDTLTYKDVKNKIAKFEIQENKNFRKVF